VADGRILRGICLAISTHLFGNGMESHKKKDSGTGWCVVFVSLCSSFDDFYRIEYVWERAIDLQNLETA